MKLTDKAQNIIDGIGANGRQRDAVRDAYRQAVRATDGLRRSIQAARVALDDADRYLTDGYSVNELGVLQRQGQEVDRWAAVRHERINTLVAILFAVGEDDPSAVAEMLLAEAR